MTPLVLAVLLAISGNVIKRDGAPVVNAHVTATRPGGGVLASAVTDADGAFKLEPVDGVVEVEAEADGFLPARMRMLADEQPVMLVMKPGAASPREKPSPREELPPNVHGTIRDAANRPIAGVEAATNSGARAITDAKGQFAIAVRGEGDVFSCNAGGNARCPFVSLKAGDRADIVVERLAAIDGVLRDHDGTPIRGASVSLRRDETSGYESDGTVTDAAGRFRFFTNPEGAGQLIARKAEHPTAVSSRLELSKEGVHGFALIMPRGINVHGVVTDANGHGIGGVTIDTASQPARQMAGGHWATTANDGSFNVRMNEGAAELLFAKKSYLATVVPIEITSSMRPLAVKLQPIVYIRGTLVRKDGSPAAKRSITAKEMLVPEVQSNADGTFELPFPKAGGYTITTGLIEHETTLRAPANDLRVVFDEGLSLRGRVVDEASGAPVTAFTIEASSGPDERSATLESDDKSGNFTFAGLLPGPATVEVTAGGYLSASVAAQAGQQEPLTIALKRGLTLRGRVRNESGQPVEHALIGIEEEDRTSSDADGTFELVGLESKESTIRVNRFGYIGRVITVAPRQFGEPLEIVLSSGLHVKGRVVTDDGQPVAIGILARSADLGAPAGHGASDASGRFEITGLAPARYDFLAGGENTALHGIVREIDVERVRDIVIPVAPYESGTVTGQVTGLSPEYVTRVAEAVGHEGGLQSAINDDGTFRIEGVATGKGSVFVEVTNASGKRRMAFEKVDVPSGGEAHVEIAFGPLRLVRGRVTRAGRPLSRASVFFNGDAGTETATTDADGRYEVRLESAPYEVSVRSGTPEIFQVMDLPYQGEVDARQTVFDVAIEAVELRLHVIDAQTGEPVAGAYVRNMVMEAALLNQETGDDGTTTVEIASGKTIALRVDKDEYGPAFIDSAGGDVVVKLAKAVKVAVRVVDARDGRALAAGVTVLDAKDRVVWSWTEPGSDGLVTFALAPGEYHFSSGFDGFEPETVRVTVPSSGEVRIALRRKTD